MTRIVDLSLAGLTAAYAGAPDATIAADEMGSIVWANDEGLRMLGAVPGTVPGTPLSVFLPVVDDWVQSSGFLQMVRGGELDVDTDLLNGRGEARTVACKTGRIALSEDGLYVVLVTLRDVTARARIEEELRSLSVTDDLTGLHNRRYLDGVMIFEEERARRLGCFLAVTFLDIDDFKSVNDNYGHSVGDQVLVAVSEAMMKQCRKVDTLCRWGGDEFVILSLIKKPADIHLIMRRLFEELAAIRISAEGGDIGVSVSSGSAISSCRRAGFSSVLIAEADSLLIDSKRKGKNRYAVAEFDDEEAPPR